MDILQNNENTASPRNEVPISKKAFLTVHEAAAYFNIGEKKLRELTNGDRCPFVLYCGTKRLIKREKFKDYLDRQFSV